jgi:Trypsin
MTGDDPCFPPGAALIGPSLVLGAAHCFGSSSSFRIGPATNSNEGELISINGVIAHPLYTPFSFDYDIMIFVLDQPTEQPFIQLERSVVSGGSYTVIGFGDTEPGPSLDLSSALQEVEVDYVENGSCDIDHGGNRQVTDGMLCATRQGKDSCSGDSGGRKFGKRLRMICCSATSTFLSSECVAREFASTLQPSCSRERDLRTIDLWESSPGAEGAPKTVTPVCTPALATITIGLWNRFV